MTTGIYVSKDSLHHLMHISSPPGALSCEEIMISRIYSAYNGLRKTLWAWYFPLRNSVNPVQTARISSPNTSKIMIKYFSTYSLLPSGKKARKLCFLYHFYTTISDHSSIFQLKMHQSIQLCFMIVILCFITWCEWWVTYMYIYWIKIGSWAPHLNKYRHGILVHCLIKVGIWKSLCWF